MDQRAEKDKYEFTPEENLALRDLSTGLMRLGVMVLIAGLLFVSYIILSFIDPPSLVTVSDALDTALAALDYAIWVFISLLVIFLSVMIIKLARPIRLIADTRGLDITHLMDFVGNLTFMSRVSFVSLIAVCALILASLIMMILVF